MECAFNRTVFIEWPIGKGLDMITTTVSESRGSPGR